MLHKHYSKQESLLNFSVIEPSFGGNFKEEVSQAREFVRLVMGLDPDAITENIDKSVYERQREKASKAESMYASMSSSAIKNVKDEILKRYRLFLEKVGLASSRIDGKERLQSKVSDLLNRIRIGSTEGVMDKDRVDFRTEIDTYTRNADSIQGTLNASERQRMYANLQDCKDFLAKIDKVWASDFTGRGIRKYPNNEKYEGDFVKGIYHGSGTYTFANANKYTGAWANGKRNGKGRLTYSAKSYYEGEWKDNLREGKGKCQYDVNQYYEGDWKADVPDGKGVKYYSATSHYKGDWKNGKREGVGTHYYSSSEYYVGQWKNDKRHGEGTLYSGSRKTVGDWVNDSFDVNGRYSIYVEAVECMESYNYKAAMELFARILDYKDARKLYAECKSVVNSFLAKERAAKFWQAFGCLILNLAFGGMPFLLLLFGNMWPGLVLLPVICLTHAAIVHEFEGNTVLACGWWCKAWTMGFMTISTIIATCLDAAAMGGAGVVFFLIFSLIEIGLCECFFSIMEGATSDYVLTGTRIAWVFEMALVLIPFAILWAALNVLVADSMWHILWIVPVCLIPRAALEIIPIRCGGIEDGPITVSAVLDAAGSLATFIYSIVVIVNNVGFHFGIFLYLGLVLAIHAVSAFAGIAIRLKAADVF